jgi:hypothetical protein
LDAGWDSDTTEIKATLKACQENRTGTTGDETTSDDQPGNLARPPALLPRGSRRSTVVRSASVMAADDEIRTSVAIGRKCRSIIAETPPQTAEVDDDLTVGPLPSRPPHFLPPH